jgi:hypothetical protein
VEHEKRILPQNELWLGVSTSCRLLGRISSDLMRNDWNLRVLWAKFRIKAEIALELLRMEVVENEFT